MSKVSFSRVDCWRQCPLKYKFRYIDGLTEEVDLSPSNPLILGKALDTGVEHGIDASIEYYYSQYPIITDEHINWTIQLEHWIPKVREIMNKGEFQVELKSDRFIGYIDYLEQPFIMDLKFSNNGDRYASSPQLSLYASELDERPEHLFYVCVPKSFIRMKKEKKDKKTGKLITPAEDLFQFRKRLKETLQGMEIQFVPVEYDQEAVDQFWKDVEIMQSATTFEPRENEFCESCGYKEFCKKPIVDVPEVKPKRKLKPRSEMNLITSIK